MSYEVIVTREAQIDLDETFVWYEEQKTGLGFEFIDEFENVINRILRTPKYASYIFKNVRAATTKRFPYEVIYRINEEKREIRIIAVSHQSRLPGWFLKRV